MDEQDWGRLVEQMGNGDCTPFLGAGACSGVLPTGEQLSRELATRYEYPFENPWDLAAVMQHATFVERDPVTAKQRVVDHLLQFGEPDYADPLELHTLLARLPITVFLTTNYDDFMLRALQRAGKRPVAATCPWYSAGADVDAPIARDYEPTVEQPLVYHLHGSCNDAASLVISEQDYVEFLAKLVIARGMDDHRIVPTQVLPALTRRPLVFLGYSLRDWSFKMLFHGLVQTLPEVRRRRHVSVQLAPSSVIDDPDAPERAEKYLEDYYASLKIAVHHATIRGFCTELSARLERA